MKSPQLFVRIDVFAKRLVVAVLPVGTHFTVPQTDEGITSLVRRLRKLGPQSVVLEATSCYEVPVAYVIFEANLPMVVSLN